MESKTSYSNSFQNHPWKNSSLFSGISDEELNHLNTHLLNANYNKGDYLIKEGTFGDAIFFIEEGRVEVKKDDFFLGEKSVGDYVGAMALIENTTRSANVIAKEPTKVKVLTINQLKAIENDEIYFKVLTNHLREQHALLKKMNKATIQETKAKLKEAEARVKITRSYFYLTLGLSLLIIILLLALLFHQH